jgi:ribosomal protein S18 acetylase RimI-like enzyme
MTNYRLALKEDLPAICALGEEVNAIHHQAFPHIFAGPGEPDRDAKHWERSLEGGDAQAFIAECDGQLVGFLTVAMASESHSFAQPLRFARVGSVSVSEWARGQGIGTELMQLAHQWVAERGGYEVRLNVWAFNEAACRLYAELGYEVRSLNMARVLPSGA